MPERTAPGRNLFLPFRQKIVRVLKPALLYLAHVIFTKGLGNRRAEERSSLGYRLHGAMQVGVRALLQ